MTGERGKNGDYFFRGDKSVLSEYFFNFAGIKNLGPVAERLGRALQKLVQRFKSARDLKRSLLCETKRGFFISERLKHFRLKTRKNKKDHSCDSR